MLMVRVSRKAADLLVIDISKHATKHDDSDTYSLVCAGASCVGIGLCNAIDQMDPESCDISVVSDQNENTVNHITIRVIKNDSRLQTILNVGLVQLQTIAEVYEEYIDLKITEV